MANFKLNDVESVLLKLGVHDVKRNFLTRATRTGLLDQATVCRLSKIGLVKKEAVPNSGTGTGLHRASRVRKSKATESSKPKK
jgi:hypothetical protein